MSADTGKIETTSAAGDVLSGFQTFAATTAATTLVTVPAGRTWVGWITLQCAAQEAAAGAVAALATGVISVAGAGVTPAAGNYLRCDALVGANVAAGLTGSDASGSNGSPFTVVAPVGNSVTIQVTATIAGTAGQVNASALGVLQ
jgi:hypothetical protein